MDLLHTEQLKNHFGQFYFTLKKIGIIRKNIFGWAKLYFGWHIIGKYFEEM